MKLNEHFNNFLRDTVNLNQSRINILEQRVETIMSFLKGSSYGATIRSFSAQGSWAHKTIIKPQPNKGFDADLVIFLDPQNEWDPAEYLEDLYMVFRRHGTYQDKVSRHTRCIMIDYAGDFSLDVVPVIVEQKFLSDSTYKVCNRNENKFELTSPLAYTDWLSKKNSITGSNHLRKIIRLMKYIRDIKGTFSVKSILLTTLLGELICSQDNFLSSPFSDAPTTLKVLIGGLDDWLQSRPVMPTISNPVLDEENFNRHWNQDKYKNFRERISQYRSWIDDAFTEADRDESIRKWQRVFGEDFAKGELSEKMTSGVALMTKNTGEQDFVEEVILKGPGVLAKIPADLPHVKSPLWQFSSSRLGVRISGTEHARRHDGQPARKIVSGEILQRNTEVCFQAVDKSGLTFLDNEYIVKWRVVNTGKEASFEGALRGGFYESEDYGIRWESTKYHGVHWVEAFVILKRTKLLVGVSERFFIVIDRSGKSPISNGRKIQWI